MGADYRPLGIHLLEDSHGAVVSSIEKKCLRDPEDIKSEIARRWLDGEGQPPTWHTLVQCLFDMEKATLAREVIAKLQGKGVDICNQQFQTYQR